MCAVGDSVTVVSPCLDHLFYYYSNFKEILEGKLNYSVLGLILTFGNQATDFTNIVTF